MLQTASPPLKPKYPPFTFLRPQRTLWSRFVEKAFKNFSPEHCQIWISMDCRSHLTNRNAGCRVFLGSLAALPCKVNWWNNADRWRHQHVPNNVSQPSFFHHKTSKPHQGFKPASPQWKATKSASELTYLLTEPFKHRVKYHLPPAAIIRSSPYSPH